MHARRYLTYIAREEEATIAHRIQTAHLKNRKRTKRTHEDPHRIAAAATAKAAAATDGIIGEPVVSGGPLPLTVGLGTGPPYVQKDVELAIDAGYRLFDTAQECTPLPSSHTALAACHA